MDDADEFAKTVLEKMGATEALLMAMRLVLLVAKTDGEREEVLTAAQDVLAAIKRVGGLTGSLPSQ